MAILYEQDFMFGGRIMKMKNVCHVRHILMNSNSTYDIIHISQIPSQNSHPTHQQTRYTDGRRN